MSRNPYTISWLNDLHHFFPALLYRPEQFETVQDVLTYVIGQAAESESYERLREAYRGEGLESKEGDIPSAHRADGPFSQRLTPIPPVRPASSFSSPFLHASSASSASSASLVSSDSDSFASLLPLLFPRRPLLSRSVFRVPLTPASMASAAFFEPVVVRPTEEQLAENTTLRILEEAMEENCAICQDPMEGGQEIRTLRACHHPFHRMCIDRWFQDSVRCPTCRHDVREEC